MILTKITGIYTLTDENGKMIACSDEDFQKDYKVDKLCVDNCDSIERKFDLDNEAIAYAGDGGRYCDPHGFSDKQIGLLQGYIDGFEKALELNKDKIFTIEDMMNCWNESLNFQSNKISFGSFIQSLKKNVWSVEIEMEFVGRGKHGIGSEVNHYTPKRDADKCLILKLIES